MSNPYSWDHTGHHKNPVGTRLSNESDQQKYARLLKFCNEKIKHYENQLRIMKEVRDNIAKDYIGTE